jgi:hypothetical protein
LQPGVAGLTLCERQRGKPHGSGFAQIRNGFALMHSSSHHRLLPQCSNAAISR